MNINFGNNQAREADLNKIVQWNTGPEMSDCEQQPRNSARGEGAESRIDQPFDGVSPV